MLIALTLAYLWKLRLQKELMVAYNYAIIPIELNLRIPNSSKFGLVS